MLCCAPATIRMNNKLKLEFVNVFCYLIIDVTLDDTHYKIVLMLGGIDLVILDKYNHPIKDKIMKLLTIIMFSDENFH
jgi:hypothetical protein